LDPKQVGELYRFLTEEVKTQPKIDLRTLVSFWQIGLKTIAGRQIGVEIPWRGEGAILIPGKDPIYHTWILEPKSGDWKLLQDYFHNQLSRLIN